MLNLGPITPEILCELRPRLFGSAVRLCDYAPGCLYIWRDFFDMSCALVSDMFICISVSEEHGLCYTYPVGDGSLETALGTISEDAAERGTPLRFCCVPKECVEVVASFFGRRPKVSYDRTWSDYLYPYENFRGYHGKALHAQRNHVNRFLREYPRHSYIPLTGDNIELARAFMRQNHARFEKDAAIAKEELIRLDELFACYKRLGLSGGLLQVDGRVVGLTIGEAVGDTLHVHVEKALTEFSGSYQMLAMSFAEMMKSEKLLYINRQDDAGDEGLRRSKLAYKPCRMLDKYYLEF